MAKLKDKVSTALNETRTLILGAQILLGFQLNAVFQPGFERLAGRQRWLDLVALALMSAAVVLLIAPAPYHRLAERARDTPLTLRFTTTMAEWALCPLGLSIGLDIFIVAQTRLGLLPSAALGFLAGLAAFFFWYGIGALHRRKRGGSPMTEKGPAAEEMETSLDERITTLMTEARVILPGAQALLGFQFIAFFSNGFEQLPEAAKLVHLASVCCVALATILLMAPAAYHRIVASGHNRPEVEHFGSRAMLGALVPLALGLSGEFYVVLSKLGYADGPAIAAALVMLALFLGLWFAYPLAARSLRDGSAPKAARRHKA